MSTYEYQREWRKQNPDKFRAYNKKYRLSSRDGQDEDVTAEVWIPTPEARECFEQACRDGRAAQDLKGQPHRLVYANRL